MRPPKYDVSMPGDFSFENKVSRLLEGTGIE